MTDAATELEAMAASFEQRRAKLIDAAAELRRERRSARTETARRAGVSCEEELLVQAQELLGVVVRLRRRADELRAGETEAA
jgi:hypothetical protein